MNTNSHSDRTLILSASERRFELQEAMQAALGIPVSVVKTFPEALTAITEAPYRAVVLDEGLMDLNPANADQFLARCRDEFPIFVKLAISGVDRCVKQVQLAMRRFERERQLASSLAQRSIHAQIHDALTSILIHSQLALTTPGLSQDAKKYLDSVLQAADAVQKAIGAKSE